MRELPAPPRDSLEFACSTGDVKAVGNIVAVNPDCINCLCRGRQHPLRIAAEKGHMEVTKQLLALGADVNTLDLWGGSALEAASTWGHLDIVELLCDAGANVRSSDLRAASYSGHLDIVKFLCEAGAPVESSSLFGKSARPGRRAGVSELSRPS